MIVGGKISEVEGKRMKKEAVKGLNINIAVDGVKVDGESIEVDYTYTVDYNNDVGSLRIKGTVIAKEDAKSAAKIKEEWDKTGRLPDNYMENLLNVISMSGSANGILIARVLDLPPPLVPPRIQIKKKGR